MPVLIVKALPQLNPKMIPPALKKTCIAIAREYGCEPTQVWATWEEIKPGMYVEGDREAAVQPQSSHPPIAELICFEGKSSDIIEKVLLAGARTLAGELGIPENIFITYREVLSGRVVSGNGVIRR
jgi:hypothetical protein